MPPRDRIFILTILLIMLSVVIISGCTTTTNTKTSPAASKTATTTTAGNEPSGAPKATTSGSTTTISGSQSGDVSVPMTQAGYIFKVETKDSNFKLDQSGSEYFMSEASLEPSGWYEQSVIKIWPSNDQGAFTVKATGPYIITIIKLPTGTPVAPPQTFTGKGQKALGPITLKAGPASFKLKGPNMMDAGFNVHLMDGTKGTLVRVVDTNDGMDISKSIYESQKTVTVPEDGDYYIMAYTSGSKGWEVAVSQ
jgi:hypothetical protein